MNISLFTSWYLISLLIILNFMAAVFLKNALKSTIKDNQWLKYIFIFPPAALVCWLMAFVYFLFSWLKSIIIDYFKD